jgi:ribosome-binding factor A
MSGEPGLRARRVAMQVRERLTDLLSRELGDPAVSAVVISDVELPDDLSVAHVKIRLLVGAEDEGRRRAALRALHRASGRLRRRVGHGLGLKRVPELRFVYDTGLDAARRVEELLHEIADENKSR